MTLCELDELFDGRYQASIGIDYHVVCVVLTVCIVTRCIELPLYNCNIIICCIVSTLAVIVYIYIQLYCEPHNPGNWTSAQWCMWVQQIQVGYIVWYYVKDTRVWALGRVQSMTKNAVVVTHVHDKTIMATISLEEKLDSIYEQLQPLESYFYNTLSSSKVIFVRK